MKYLHFFHLLFILSFHTYTITYEHISSYPYISGNSFRAICNHFCDDTGVSFSPDQVKNGDLIFVKTDNLDYFFKKIHPLIKNRYILISHNSDYSVPGRFITFLEDTSIIAWFGQNPDIYSHPKFFPLPIGIANSCWEHGTVSHFDTVIEEIKKDSVSKKHLLILNFNTSKYLKERNYVFRLFHDKPFCCFDQSTHLHYLRNMAQSKYVLNPRGNGLDCHRLWEALLVGCIPIVKSSPLNSLFTDLPVLVVENWEQITEEYLEFMYPIIVNKSFNREKLYMDYWISLINEMKK